MSQIDYPTDLELDSDKDVHLDGANDLAVIGGLGQLSQSVAIDVMDVTQDFIGQPITGATVGLLEEQIRQSISDDPQVETPTTVDVTTYDKRNRSVTAVVETKADETFEIQVTA